jgi:hypothetical protein
MSGINDDFIKKFLGQNRLTPQQQKDLLKKQRLQEYYSKKSNKIKNLDENAKKNISLSMDKIFENVKSKSSTEKIKTYDYAWTTHMTPYGVFYYNKEQKVWANAFGKVSKSFEELVDFSMIIDPTPTANYKNSRSNQSEFILLFDSYGGGDYWSDVQQQSAGNNYNNETYKFNSSFYEYGTAPTGYSTTGQNSGWRRKIPSEYYSYKSKPKPVIVTNMGSYGLYPYVFYSSEITQNYPNSVPLPNGFTLGYYYQSSYYPNIVLTNSNFSGLTSSNPVSYKENGVINYSNFDNTGRGITAINLYGSTALYYIGLTGPVPLNGDEIEGFDASTVWPQRNEASLIPVHDIVGCITYTISAFRAFYVNNPEYQEPDYDNNAVIDHYVALSFGYAAVISGIIDAMDFYVNIAPGIISADRISIGYNGLHVNRYDAITSMNEVNRVFKYIKTLNDGSQKNNDIKEAVLQNIRTFILPGYASGDQNSIREYNKFVKILNNFHKLKFSFYDTLAGLVHPGYLNSCSSGYMDLYSAIGSGVTCGSSTLSTKFYSRTPYHLAGITYPFFTYDASSIIPIYTVEDVTLNLPNNNLVTIEPYYIREGTQNFETYKNIINSKYSRSFKMSNSTNGALKYVDWVYYLSEEFEIYSNDYERAAWNYFVSSYVKFTTNHYRDLSVPVICMQTQQSVISSGDTVNLASNGYVLLDPNLNFMRTIQPIIDAGLDGIGTYASYDGYMRNTLQGLDQMSYNYHNNLDPNLSTGTRFSINTSIAQRFGRNISVGSYKTHPKCDIKKFITNIDDDVDAIAAIQGMNYSQIMSPGDTATIDWSTSFPNYRGLTFNGYIQTLMGNCYQHTNTGNGVYQNTVSRKEEVQKIIDVNRDWAKIFYETALTYKYGSII